MPNSSSAVTTKVDGNVLAVVLNRPEKRNAISTSMAERLNQIFEEFESDNRLSVAVITGEGAAFCAGADLTELNEERAFTLPPRGFAGICGRPPSKPLIAAVNGYAFGGGLEIALACDLILASPSAQFALPEVTHGLAPLGGGVSRLRSRIPESIANRLILTGQVFTATEAAEWDLVTLVRQTGVLEAAMELAHEIAAQPVAGLKACTRLIREDDAREEAWRSDGARRVVGLMRGDD